MAVETELLTADGNALWIVPCVQWSEKQLFLPPFWLVRRSKDSSVVNTELKEITVSLLSECKTDRASGLEGGRSVRTSHRTDVRVPCLRNVRAVEAGSELVVYAKKSNLKPVVKTTSRTWIDEARVTLKKK